MIHSKERWVIMSKDRKYIAKGTPRNRHLIKVDDDKDKKRVMTYSSKGRARSAYETSGFYGTFDIEGYSGYNDNLSKYLEPVKVRVIMEEINESN